MSRIPKTEYSPAVALDHALHLLLHHPLTDEMRKHIAYLLREAADKLENVKR